MLHPRRVVGSLRSTATAIAAIVGVSNLLAAQAPQPAAHAYRQAFPLSIDLRLNSSPALAVVDAQVVHVPGAASLRLVFDEVDLGPGDRLDIRSLADGEVHALTRRQLAAWNSTSAYLNGDTVIVELVLAPGSRGRWELDEVVVGTGILVPFNLCGADDRVASNDPRVARLLDDGGSWVCTGWLAPGECAFTAGHCQINADLAQFNVPPSLPNGALQHPPVEDQFPTDPTSFISELVGEGQDWAVHKLLTNSLGEDAHAKYGWFELVDQLPAPSAAVRVTGFGSDAVAANYSQQTHVGPFVGASGVVNSVIEFLVDIKPGSSGSPIIDQSDDRVLGIVTNSGCGTPIGHNIGTSILLPSVQQAIAGHCQSTALGADFEVVPSVAQPGQVVHFRDVSTGTPVAWDWDLDGDGATDGQGASATFSYPLIGTWPATLGVWSSEAQDATTQPSAVTVLATAPASIPYAQPFDAGLPKDGAWTFSTTGGEGQIETVTFAGPSPGSGHPALALATAVDGFDTTKEAVLHLDLSAGTDVLLTYWYRETDDEDHPEDGVFLSDGNVEVLAQSHQGGPVEWTEFSVNVGQVATAAGFAPSDDFRVIFRQRDNYGLGSDGILLDDVRVDAAPTGAWLAGSPATVSTKLGGTQTLELHAGAEHAGRLYLAAGSASGTTPASTIAGVTIPLVIDSYFLYTLAEPNLGPLYDAAGFLDPAGYASFRFELPMFSDSALVGLSLHHAAVVLDVDAGGAGSGAIVAVTDAVPVSIVL